MIRYLLLGLALAAVDAKAIERWQALPPTPAPIKSERSGHAKANGINGHTKPYLAQQVDPLSWDREADGRPSPN